MSGGIDSPVALYLMAKNSNIDVTALHMDNRPFTDDMETEKPKRLVEGVEGSTGRTISLYLAPFGEFAQSELARKCDRHVHCVLCKRMMLRVAEGFGNTIGAEAIITGESLGQVASQTLDNLVVEEDAVSVPVLRPLIGLDKSEIIAIARDIGTYDVSIGSGLCCTLVPEKPSTSATLERVANEEARIDVRGVAQRILDGTRIVHGP